MVRRCWSASEVQILKRGLQRGESYADLEKDLGRTRKAISRKIDRLFAEGKLSDVFPDEEEDGLNNNDDDDFKETDSGARDNLLAAVGYRGRMPCEAAEVSQAARRSNAPGSIHRPSRETEHNDGRSDDPMDGERTPVQPFSTTARTGTGPTLERSLRQETLALQDQLARLTESHQDDSWTLSEVLSTLDELEATMRSIRHRVQQMYLSNFGDENA